MAIQSTDGAVTSPLQTSATTISILAAQGKPVAASPSFIPIKWIGGAAAIAIVYYQFPKSRIVLNGIILLILLGLILGHYPTIKKEFQFIAKG